MSKIAVLFVCLGNICRSPLAEAAFRMEAERLGLTAEVDSAGTGDWHVGHAPDKRAQAEARRRGIDISELRARQLSVDDFYRFNLILAADETNLRDALAIRPADATADLRLMLDLIPGRGGKGVTDPYYGKDDGFASTWEDVDAVASALVAEFSPKG